MKIMWWVVGILIAIGVLGYFLDPASPRTRKTAPGPDQGPPLPAGMDGFGNTESDDDGSSGGW